MNIKHHIALLAACVLATGVISCKTESDDAREKDAPAKIQYAEYTPTNGGAWIKYTRPADEDFLYVRAEYTLDNGQVISRSSSVYVDSLSISGFGSVKEYDVKLYACDYFANESEPYHLAVTPMEPNVMAVEQTVRVRAGFAGIVIELENPALESVDVYVDIEAKDGSGRKATRIFTSQIAADKLMVTDLEAIPYDVISMITLLSLSIRARSLLRLTMSWTSLLGLSSAMSCFMVATGAQLLQTLITLVCTLWTQ